MRFSETHQSLFSCLSQQTFLFQSIVPIVLGLIQRGRVLFAYVWNVGRFSPHAFLKQLSFFWDSNSDSNIVSHLFYFSIVLEDHDLFYASRRFPSFSSKRTVPLSLEAYAPTIGSHPNWTFKISKRINLCMYCSFSCPDLWFMFLTTT